MANKYYNKKFAEARDINAKAFLTNMLLQFGREFKTAQYDMHNRDRSIELFGVDGDTYFSYCRALGYLDTDYNPSSQEVRLYITDKGLEFMK